MRITDLLKKEGIKIGVSVADKVDAIEQLVSLHEAAGNLKDVAAYKAGILAREEQGTTAIGMEIAIPHAKSESVEKPALTAITIPEGVDYGAPDGKPCKLLFMIAATTDGDVHLEVLARLMQMLADSEFTDELKASKSAEEFLEIIDRKESEKADEEAASKKEEKKGYRVLAVTACPTGIAHTYMAAENLAKAGEEMGITIKVETNGSGGAKNVLTKKEIEECDGIIIAADKSVETARFDGKPVLSTKVADGIHKPQELINKIINGEAPVFHSDKKENGNDDAGGESFGRKLYKHLMNGVSHMLPFVVAGGIFIAIAFLIDAAKGVPMDGNTAFGTVTPVAAWFKTIGGYAFNFLLPVLAGFIAMSIADRPGFLVGMVGGFLASNGATFTNPSANNAIPSGFLGALLAGFIGGLLMKLIAKACEKLPKALEGIKPMLIYPLAGLGLVAVMMCAVNPVMGVINTAIKSGLEWLMEKDLLVLLGCLLGAMMATDMGGPLNKTAYLFGSGLLADTFTAIEKGEATIQSSQPAFIIMAAVMIGGMVPPIALALSTTFFKKRWTADERKNTLTNYIMGLSFITEGAIPYAASHPLQVIPSCMVGSAVAGGLSAFFKCTLMAPHGGVFVVPTIGKPWLYLLSLVIGSIVGMLMLALLKRPVKQED